jgi:hypothetical protein
MNQKITFGIKEILPRQEEVYHSQGIIDISRVHDRIHDIYLDSMELFTRKADPVGLLSELSIEQFRPVFDGEGKNAEENPLRYIYPRADHLALYALTLGPKLSETIGELFDSKEFALATMLDSVASLAADKAVENLETTYHDQLLKSGRITREQVVLGYSPGYCGWDISGQKRLFELLHPEQIDLSLNESCLMVPLKSITGVLVAGNAEIHFFENDFPFCPNCEIYSCRLRMERAMRT